MTIDRRAFFDKVRTELFSGELTQPQVDGIAAILDAFETRRPTGDRRWLAYALATAHHETAFTFQPVSERGTAAYFERLYGIAGGNPERARRMGNLVPGDGARYHGRGLVQLTFKANYAAMATHLTRLAGKPVDLVGEPDLACRLDYAVEILLHGMERGVFTDHRLAEYFRRDTSGRPTREAWVGARAIVNGRDRAEAIAGYGRTFLVALGGRPMVAPEEDEVPR
jgi:putative chitinase